MNKHIEAIEKALEHAKAKHPHFCDEMCNSHTLGQSRETLKFQREMLKRQVEGGYASAVTILVCELAEAIEAFSRGDYAHCLEELAQVGAVNIRMMEAVEEKMKVGQS
jgi:hypothetical protein